MQKQDSSLTDAPEFQELIKILQTFRDEELQISLLQLNLVFQALRLSFYVKILPYSALTSLSMILLTYLISSPLYSIL